MQRNISFAEGEYYHVYNRGVEKREIFRSDADRYHFMKLLYLTNGEKPLIFRELKKLPLEQIEIGNRQTSIGAYALMPNHFHLLIKQTKEGGLTKFLEKLSTSYAMYFNKKYNRVGPLFQGRFKAEHVDKDEYLKYLFAYIHLNPIKLFDSNWKKIGIGNRKDAEQFLKNYPFSSFADYSTAQQSEFSVIIDRSAFPDYFENKKDFSELIADWLDYNNDT